VRNTTELLRLIVVQDRGHARVRDFTAVLQAEADVITRIGWRSLRLLSEDRKPLDIMSLLPEGEQPSEHIVWLKGVQVALRLVIPRIPPENAARCRKPMARKASKSGHKMAPRTPIAAKTRPSAWLRSRVVSLQTGIFSNGCARRNP
jgi:hypothetical protein